MRFRPLLLMVVFGLHAALSLGEEPFVRGDADQNGILGLTDAVRIFGFLFRGDEAFACPDASDSNDSGEVDISDGIYLLSFLFTGGPQPPLPYPGAGLDPTPDSLACGASQSCKTFINSVGMQLVFIPSGSFLMGSPEDEPGHWYNEGPVHWVRITRGFYMGATEVTQGQYEAVMGTNPSFYTGPRFGVDPDRPVERVNWGEAVEFTERLSELEGERYRLPTEAEWEYACRAGTTTRFSFGDGRTCSSGCFPCSAVDDHLWWCGNTPGGSTQPVGQTLPNPWCLYGMHGNVSEWCQDWLGRYPDGEVTDPQGPPTGEEKVIRGGFREALLTGCRSAKRGDFSVEHRFDSVGLRVVLEAPVAGGKTGGR